MTMNKPHEGLEAVESRRFKSMLNKKAIMNELSVAGSSRLQKERKSLE